MQIFHRSTNTISRATIFGAVFILAAALWACIQFHVGGLGIDCRYCHTSVEVSSFAGIPPTKTCMNCHSQIWTGAALLEPVRQSYRTGQSLIWNRVNDLPDFVYFNHSIHINKGVGCNTCHGPVDRMPLMYNYASLQMEWCLDCHRAPEKYLRPRDQVFNMRYEEPSSAKPVTFAGKDYSDQRTLGLDLARQYKLRSVYDITSCSTCHR
jgi:cytochrome c7-like protein